ncbi:MAG: META domain-containing protein [Chloroflexota bacterium]
MRRFVLFAMVVATSTLLAACAAGGAAGLTGKDWQLTAITEKVPAFQGVVPAAEQSKYTITFATDLTFRGTADCNQIAGTYKTTGSNGLSIQLGVSTMAFCPEGSMADLYVHALSRAKTWAIAGDTLTITLDDEGTLAFVAGAAASGPPAASASSATTAASAAPTAKATQTPSAAPTAKPTAKPTAAATKAPGAATPAPTQATGLLGKTWQLTTITEKVPAFQGAVPAADQPNYTVAFAADGTFSAKADCNTVAGKYTAADAKASSGSLAIVPGPTTTAACPQGSLSDLYILGLANAASYATVDGALTITLEDDGTLVFK